MQLRWRQHYSAPSCFRRERIRAVEHLDRPDLDTTERARSYRDLERISRLPFQFKPLWRAVREIASRERNRADALRLLEVGAGTGAVGLRLARLLARTMGFRVELITTDIRPESLPLPSEEEGVVVVPRRLDALAEPIPPCDIAIANLVIHHFENDEAGELLRRLREASRLGGAVFDLERCFLAFALLRCFFPFWALSPVTPADALISVQQAFTPEELLALSRTAGMRKPRVRRFLGVRLLLSWEAPGAGE